MIDRLEKWSESGLRIGTCNYDTLTFCEYMRWKNIKIIDITGHSCCYTEDWLIDCSLGAIWKNLGLTKTIIFALLGKQPYKTTSYFNYDSFRSFWDYSYKKETLWDGVSEYDVPIDLLIKRVVIEGEEMNIGKFSDYIR